MTREEIERIHDALLLEATTKINEQRAEIEELEEREQVAVWYESLVTRARIGTAKTPSLKAYIEQIEAEIERLKAQLATAKAEREELMDNLESCKGNELAAQNEILQQELDQFRRADKKQLFKVATEQQREAL